MASVNKRFEGTPRAGFRIRFYQGEKQRETFLPGSSKAIERMARKIAEHCEALAMAQEKNIAPPADSAAWAQSVDGVLRESLVAWGLAESQSEKLGTDAGRLLGAFLDAYIADREWAKLTTKRNYEQTRRLLVEYFGREKPLASITRADGKRWREWMIAKPLAEATVAKHCKRAKTLFSHAVDDRLLSESPLAKLVAGSESNRERLFFVSSADAQKILKACPDADWRLIFSLCRWGGLRCPSEVLNLKWHDVLWDQSKIRIPAEGKTGVRFCPIFPEMLVALREAFEAAPDGAVHCVQRYRGGDTNLRTQFGRILGAAGVNPWPRLFHNLRSTRRTELQERFPDHVLNEWLGHSSKVAAKHYLQVTEQHWSDASEFDSLASSLTSSLASGTASTTSNPQTIKKPSDLLGSDGNRVTLRAIQVTPTGLEHAYNSQGNIDVRDAVPLPVPLQSSIHSSELAELVELWPALSDPQRVKVLRLAWACVAEG